MNTDATATPQGRQSGNGHERSDARAGWIFAIIFLLGIAGLGIHFVMGGVQKVFQKQAEPSDRLASAAGLRRATPPSADRFPPLQVNPPLDLLAFRAREEAQLNSYGWIDRTAGIVRIPIDRAMDLLLVRGLPVRQATNRDGLGPSSWQLQQQRAAGTNSTAQPPP
jgi:hypothetical protein